VSDDTNNNFTQILKLYRNQLKEGIQIENICTLMHDQICKAFMYIDVNYRYDCKVMHDLFAILASIFNPCITLHLSL